VTRFCVGMRGREISPGGPARPAPGPWRSFVRWDSGRASMERDTVRKLGMYSRKKFYAPEPNWVQWCVWQLIGTVAGLGLGWWLFL
jgi:hypothetical protein